MTAIRLGTRLMNISDAFKALVATTSAKITIACEIKAILNPIVDER